MRLRTLVALLLVGIASAATAADAEMKKLDFLLGEWKGEGAMQRGPGPAQPSFIHEVVRFHAGGKVLAIQGKGNLKLEDGSAGALVHDAFGVVWWDAGEKRYRFSAFTAQAGHVDASFELTGERSVVWAFSTPQGKVRYSIRMTDAGEWNEVGEWSRDGGEWAKFFEMTLARLNE